MCKRSFLAALLFAGIVVFAFGAGQQEGATAGEEGPIEVEMVCRLLKYAPPESGNPFQDAVRDEWGLDITYSMIDASEFANKMSLLFAAGDYPEWIRNENQRADSYDRWGPEGYLIAFSDHWDKLPNYRSAFPEDRWEFLLENNASPDGKVYYLPAYTAGRLEYWNAHNYRERTIKDWGLDYPETKEELRELGQAIKENDGPNSYLFAHRSGLSGFVEQFVRGYRTQSGFYRDPDVGEVVYGPATEKWREMMTFIRELYQEGYINPEFATSTKQQWQEQIAAGTGYMWWWYGSTAKAEAFDQMMGEEGEWGWATEHFSAYDDQGPFVNWSPQPKPNKWGTALTDKVTGEKLERIMEFLNWASSPEGATFVNYGIPGVTFVDDGQGRPKLDEEGNVIWTEEFQGMDAYQDKLRRAGFGIYFGPKGTEYVASNSPRYQMDKKLSEAMDRHVAEDGYTRIDASFGGFKVAEDEADETGNLSTQISDTAQPYWLKMIVDEGMDPADDAVWESYLNDLEKNGLGRLLELRKIQYDRMH